MGYFRLRLKSANSFWECGGIGRRAGLKIRRAIKLVGVQVPPLPFLNYLLLVLSITFYNCYVLTKKQEIQMESILNNSVATLVTYLGIFSIYLLFVPLILFYWMNNRWNVMGKLERLGVYGLVFLFFPGLILFSPFLNLRFRGDSKG